MANRKSIAEKIEKLKQMATLGLEESEQLLGEGRRRWSIPDRRIVMRYLIDVVKGGMDRKRWAMLHPAEWKRLVEIAPLKSGRPTA